MSIHHGRVLQIVPHLPGGFDGVGDHALNLARALSNDFGISTTFLVAEKTSANSKDGYAIISGLNPETCEQLARDHEHVILHYVNYGYQMRGVPFLLRAFAKQLRSQLRGRWITTFHELYASGPPWKSEFWLRPFQVKIARDLIDLSDVCFVSNEIMEQEIRRHDPLKQVRLVPVMSNFGEPTLTDFAIASPKRWAICGGTALLNRSLLSFERIQQLIPAAFYPNHLDAIGGRDTESTREIVERLARQVPGLACHYHPEVSVEEGSRLLAQASFSWLDYFGNGEMSPGMVLKSSVFGAYSAHGVVTIFSHREESLALEQDRFPGPWFLTPNGARFPDPVRLSEVREKIYSWYWAHAASPRLVRLYADALATVP
jgi:hypothetical protein